MGAWKLNSTTISNSLVFRLVNYVIGWGSGEFNLRYGAFELCDMADSRRIRLCKIANLVRYTIFLIAPEDHSV